MAANLKGIINRVLASQGQKQIDNVSRFLKAMDGQPRTIKNEWLEDLNAVLSKQHTIDKLKTDIPIKTEWFKSKSMIGELEQIRQALTAKRGQYSEKLDVNKHYKVKSVEQYFGTVYKDIYELSISKQIIKNAFISQQALADYISAYLNAIDKVYALTWSERILGLLRAVPIIYKTDFNKKDGIILGKELDLILSALGQISPLFNVAGLPSYLKKEDRLFVVSRRYKTKIKWEALASLFGSSYVDDIMDNMVEYDFGDNGATLACIVDKKDYYMFEDRLVENTTQDWARTLIEDRYLHDWKKGTRVEFSVGLRIVDSNIYTLGDGDKVDWKNSNGSLNGLSYYVKTDGGEILYKDEPEIIVIEDKDILDVEIPRYYELDLETIVRVLPKQTDGINNPVSLKTFLINNNIELNDKNFEVVSVDSNGFVLKAVKGLTNVDEFHDQIRFDTQMFTTKVEEKTDKVVDYEAKFEVQNKLIQDLQKQSEQQLKLINDLLSKQKTEKVKE